MLRIGIDIGGTFTDFVVHNPENGNLTTFKLLTDPENPARTLFQGMQRIGENQPSQIIHGSTVATNALLERKGAPTALITTKGFKDVIQIARQNRPDLYDLFVKPLPELVPAEFRFEITERVDFHGNVLTSLDISELDEIICNLGSNNIKSVAVCFLFSFLYPEHEKAIAKKLRSSGYFVSVSNEVLPEYREYERTSTTVVNAYVSPILENYLSELENSLPMSTIDVMQSNGGMISLDDASQNGARCILSGPAGGVVGAQNIAQRLLVKDASRQNPEEVKLITFDMGGTSTDVSLINGEPGFTTEAAIGGFPIHLPMLDIHTIGAGGGSIAYVDQGGSLRVGPQSAGAYPGPACYGLGDAPTVTDANLVLGRLLPEYFLGGKMKIDPERSLLSLTKLGASMGLSAVETASGVIEVVNAQMERALRVISVERGYDPRDFSLFSFGGAGGLHAMELARHMGIPKVIISKYASTLSAYGMLASNIIKDYVRTVMLPGSISIKDIGRLFNPMIEQGKKDLQNEGISVSEIELQTSLDMRYRGQSYELNIPYSEKFIETFHHAHQFNYGYSYPDKPSEIVNLRLRAIGKVQPIKLPIVSQRTKKLKPIPMLSIPITLEKSLSTIPVYNYDNLLPGTRLVGPVLIVSADTTIFLNINDILQVDQYQNLIIDVHLDKTG